MKPIVLILIFLQTAFAYASHFESGYITYRYIGDSTGIYHHYEIELTIYRDTTGANMGNTQSIYIRSSCYGVQSLTLILADSNSVLSSINECVNAAGSFTYARKFRYKGTKVLSGLCSDWSFEWYGCCRPPGSSNIYDSGSQDLGLKAWLNNFAGNNSAARAAEFDPRSFCTGRTFHWNRNFTDPDGDSVYVYPSTIYGRSGSLITPISYDSIYSASYPLDLDSTIGWDVNPVNGNVTFHPTQIGKFNVGFAVEEYRYDSTYSLWVKAGEQYNESVAIVSALCSVSDSAHLSNTDSLVMDCGSLGVIFPASRPYYSSSLLPSDFILFDPDDSLIAVQQAWSLGMNGILADSISLMFEDSLNRNGLFKLVIRTGSDGNTLLAPCGTEFNAYDTLYVRVSNCTSIGMEGNPSNSFSLYPNPADRELRITFDHPGNGKYSLYTISGQRVQSGTFFKKANYTVDVGDLPPGIYILRIHQANRDQMKRVVIY